MIVQLVLWSLADSTTTVEELRRHLADEEVEAFADADGLRLATWVSDEPGERWGAVYLWEGEPGEAVTARVRELIGKDPDLVETFDVEATVEGRYAAGELSRRGLAFDD